VRERNETSAGGVVYRQVAGEIDVVIATQCDRLSGADNLRLPKGIVEPGETPERTAAREVAEEIGVEARVVAALGESRYGYEEPDTRVSKRVVYFLLEHVSGEPHPRDGEMRAARWCPVDEAARVLSFENERAAVERAARQLRAVRA
jgi:8-oxo-dGTP pyrophosphatase MutT (NUDIX family)